MYVANTRASSISRIVIATKVVERLWATGLNGPQQIAIDPANTFMYATNYRNNTISQINMSTGGPAIPFITTGLSNPTGILIDSTNTNMYVANSLNSVNTITQIIISTKVATTYVSTSFGLNNPNGIVKSLNNEFMYVANADNNKISQISLPAAPTPTLTAIDQPSGRVSGNQIVTLTGTNFTGATSVTFGGVNAPVFTVVSSTSIICLTPPGTTAGPVSVLITTPYGTNAANTAYSYAADTSVEDARTNASYNITIKRISNGVIIATNLKSKSKFKTRQLTIVIAGKKTPMSVERGTTTQKTVATAPGRRTVKVYDGKLLLKSRTITVPE